MSIKVLVTGSNGQLGKTLQELFSNNKEAIEFVFSTKETLDLTSNSSIAKTFSTHKFQYCINCAAYTNVEAAEDNPELAHKVNAIAVANLAKACNENRTTLIHISTDYVFDGTKTKPYTPEDTPNPINQYGISKLKGEQNIATHLSNYFIIRTSWLYSAFGKNFLKTIVSKIKEGVDLKITTSEKGTPTSCVDLANFIVYLIISQSQNYGLYHYSNLGQSNWYEFALEIAKAKTLQNKVKIDPVSNFKTKAKRPVYSVLSKEKTTNTFAIEIPNWKDSVSSLLKNFL
ncbi:dTDP-4-dehydrorhamnose reductase [Lacinutrix salivirga]